MENKPLILVADSAKLALRNMESILSELYEVAMTSEGTDILDFLQFEQPALILMNAKLVGMNGFEVLEKLKERESTRDIPVILMTSKKDTESELRGLRAGAMDFVSLPFEPEVLKARIAHIIELTELRRYQASEIAKQKNQLNRLALQSILTIAHTVDTKDRYANKHSVRVALYCREIAKRMGYNEKQIEDLYHMALLHDIGKIGVEDTILNKASDLTEEEYEVVKRHAEIGADILQNTKFIPGVVEAVRYHHEWYDGSGYVGIAGEEIPEAARIIAVADAYDSMTSNRAYRQSLPRERVMEELIMGRGTQFDPYIIDVFLELLEDGLVIDEDSVEREVNQEDEIAEAGVLLRQVFAESVQETQNELEKDSLTGFLKRKYFDEKVNNYLLQPKSRGTFFMMDLDNFKSVNDMYGHASGDELIQIFADVLRANIRDNDFVCRIGGDEFAIFFPDMDKDLVIAERAESIISLFSKRKEEAGYGICSVSIGIMTKYITDEQMTGEELYKKADKALYYVKNNGKDDYHAYAYLSKEAQLDQQSIKQMDLKSLMRHISERKYRRGAYAVEYDRFSYIYRFIMRNLERSRQHVQIILITLDVPEGLRQPLMHVEDSLMLLETAIVRSLRRGDVTTRFGLTQQVVILMEATLENGKMVAERIMGKYLSLCGDNFIKATYDITEMPLEKKE